MKIIDQFRANGKSDSWTPPGPEGIDPVSTQSRRWTKAVNVHETVELLTTFGTMLYPALAQEIPQSRPRRNDDRPCIAAPSPLHRPRPGPVDFSSIFLVTSTTGPVLENVNSGRSREIPGALRGLGEIQRSDSALFSQGNCNIPRIQKCD